MSGSPKSNRITLGQKEVLRLSPSLPFKARMIL